MSVGSCKATQLWPKLTPSFLPMGSQRCSAQGCGFTHTCPAPKAAWAVLGQEVLRKERGEHLEGRGEYLEGRFLSSEGAGQVPAASAPGDKPQWDFPAELEPVV